MVALSDLIATSDTGNIYTDALLWDFVYRPGYTITYAFDPGSSQSGAQNGGSIWQNTGAADAFNQAMAFWAEVANISYQQSPTFSGNALQYTWVERIENLPGDTIGQHNLPGTGVMEGKYDSRVPWFNAQGHAEGGLGFVTFLHEIGHALGLEHPHDSGLFPGVSDGDGSDTGSFGLNQGVFTTMTYNDGYATVKGLSPSLNYGWQATPMAFDVAAIQHLYGANMSTRTGDDIYILPGANASGTAYRAIWDAGGIDELRYDGLRDTVIDLNAASLRAENGGGGWLSSAEGIFGGWTIANGVVIENATGGGGDDVIMGNAAANQLIGGDGNDSIRGGAGADTIEGGSGKDTLGGGAGADVFVYTSFTDSPFGSHDRISGFEAGTDKIDLSDLGPVSITLSLTFSGSGGGSLEAASDSGALYINVFGFDGLTIDDILFASVTPPLDLGFTSSSIFEDAGVGTVIGQASITNSGSGILSYSLTTNPYGAFAIDSQTGVVSVLKAGAIDFEFTQIYSIGIGVAESGTRATVSEFFISIDDVVETDAIVGSAEPDRLRPATNADVSIYGNDGDDVIAARLGDDTLVGGDGDDTYFIRNHEDIILEAETGGTDNARIYVEGYVLPSYVEDGRLVGPVARLGLGNDFGNLLTGNGGSDTLNAAAGDDTLSGNGAGDELNGEDGDDRLLGGGGGDTLNGGTGNDRLEGDADKDILDGGDGDDRLYGGEGRDTMIGGAGADRFVFGEGDTAATTLQADRILDFDQGSGDLIDLRSIDAVAGGSDDGFTFIGSASFSGTAGELRYQQVADETRIFGDMDGDGAADLAIRLETIMVPSTSDFFL